MGTKLLTVEDSPEIRDEITSCLSDEGYIVVTAEDGLMGWEKIHEQPDIEMIILDQNMPRMQGLQLAEKIRTELKSEVPIVMLTTESSPEFREKGKELGIKYWIVKPFEGSRMLKLAEKITGGAAPQP